MRKLIFGINLTVDGCCDHTKGIPDDEVMEYFTRLTQEADILLYGRKTYELMVPYWPDVAKNPAEQTKADIDFAQAFMSVPRIVVVSKTLKHPGDENTSIIGANLQNEIQKLKQEPGKNILTGGVDLPSQLLAMNLIDEIRVVVHPVIAGEGRRLFDHLNLQETFSLKLVESKVFKSGCVALRYIR